VTDYTHRRSFLVRHGVEIAVVIGLLALVVLLIISSKRAESNCVGNGGQWITGFTSNGGGFSICIPRRNQ
jgi:hypothetical protein